MDATHDGVRRRVRDRYAKAATSPAPEACCGPSCCGSLYSPEDLARIPDGAVLNLGSGNPVRHAVLRVGEVVADLGSGAGVDVFLAASLVGPAGRAIGIDMTPEMVARAGATADREGLRNVEFRKGTIERLPLDDVSVDVVLSNCVINLSPDKGAVFGEAFRILRPGGRLVVSDIVQERPLGAIDDDCGCISTAMVRADYLQTITRAGFEGLEVVEDRAWLSSGGRVDASAITIRATKPKEVNA